MVSQAQEAALNTTGLIASIGGPENIKSITEGSAPAATRRELFRNTNRTNFRDDESEKRSKDKPYAGKKRHICSFFARGKCTRGDACPNM